MDGSGTGTSVLLEEAERRLRRLSPERLTVARDFLTYLDEREEQEATQELLRLAGFEEAYRKALQQAQSGQVVEFAGIRRDA
jgi:hypothetical protein